MKNWRRVLTGTLIVILMVTSTGLGGCFSPAKDGALTLKPATLSPPAISKENTLRVGVDSSNAPFTSSSEGKIIGIDVDIAAAMAEELGLRLEIVDTKGQNVSRLLQDGTIDVAMSVLGDSIVKETFMDEFTGVKVGPYLVDGPAIFTVGVSETSSAFDPTKLEGVKVAVQETSLSAWRIAKDYGEENLVTFPTMGDAFNELQNGGVSYVAADAIRGSFLAVTKDNIRCEGIISDMQGVYMGVASDKTELVTEMTKALRALRDNGNLQLIITKWLGPQSAKAVSSDQAIVSINGPESSTTTDKPGTGG